MDTFIIILAVICTFVVGFVLGYETRKSGDSPVGTIHVDNSDGEGPYLFLEVDSHATFAKMKNGKIIRMRIKTENFVRDEDNDLNEGGE